MLNRKTFIDILADEYPEMTKIQLNKILDMIFGGIIKACKEYGGVRFVDFGTFTLKQYDSRVARNPKTMEEVEIAPYKTIRFKLGLKTKKLINEN